MATSDSQSAAQLEAVIAELDEDHDVRRGSIVRLVAEQVRRRLSAELREQRTNRGVSQVEVARLLGTSQPAIARLEAGLADPKLSTLARYAAALGVELSFDWRPSEALAREGLGAAVVGR